MNRKMFKKDSLIENKLSKLEKFLEENNIVIYGIESISIDKYKFTIEDTDNSTRYACLPRTFDTERLFLIDN